MMPCAPENHEFDWGVDNFLQNADAAEFPRLCANMRTADKTLYFEPYNVFETGELQGGHHRAGYPGKP